MFEGDLSHRACVLLFTKPPRPGRVKTRLIGELSAEEAAELHAAFLGDIEESLRRGGFGLCVAWALDAGDPLPAGPATTTSTAAATAGFRQQGEDLGARLYNGLRRMADSYEMIAAVGSDSPELGPEIVEDAFARLAAGTDVVIGPTRDGGYYLIGVRRETLRRELFDGIAWSTESVLDQTRESCRELGLAVELLPEIDDVDVGEDLRRLARRLGAAGDPPPRTRALLAAWGRIPAAAAGRDEG
ncbi:MAG: TIGR04282 family arsenosugar biosynthesis glycosyltransferase [Thermoanaerobaculia bacterium]